MATVTVIYPVPAAGAKPFDWDYYLSKHMPLVESKFKPHGLKKWEAIKVDPASGYDTLCTLVWDNSAAFAKAFEVDGPEVLGDVKNFSTVEPIRVWGEIAGGSS